MQARIVGSLIMRPAFSPPTEVAEYRIVRLLGRGAMGQVYLAHDTLLDRPVAIKFIAAEPSPALRERFLVEARAIARLTHPNVVSVYRVGEHAGRPYLVSEFVRGHSLSALAKPISVEQALQIGLGLAAGLKAAHQRGVLHRDVKPANAMLAESGEAKLLDFGFAKLVSGGQSVPSESVDPPSLREHEEISGDEATLSAEGERAARGGVPAPSPEVTLSVPGEVAASVASPSPPEAVVEQASLTKTGALIGTPRYMAPEIFAGQAATTRSDVYSLGALLFELLVGKPPFGEPDLVRLSVAVQLREAPPLRPLLPDGELADGFAAVVDRCLARDPQRRYADGAELVAALLAMSSPTRAVVPAASRRSSRWILVGMGALLAAALALRPLLLSVPRPEIPSGRPSATPLPGLSKAVDLGVPADLRASPDLSPVRERLPAPVDGAVIRISEAPKPGSGSAVRRPPVNIGKRPAVSPPALAPAPPVVAPAKPAASDTVEIPIER